MAQGSGEGLQPPLPRRGQHAVKPGIGLPHRNLLGVRRKANTVVAEVEPSLLLVHIVGGHGSQRVQLLACVPQYERKAAGANRPTRPLLARGEGMELAAPPRSIMTSRREENPNRKLQPLWGPTDTAAKARGATVGDNHRGPLITG
jgi:hypothetical protein